ncbi:hypothetical protein JQ628_26885 [Bradyrhizobium lablabi]|uniref:hypothetical protein n=1 Tax=Bradyrhizobium lablabi TaxID=722472 RepID=UPI001BAC9668|nr:hypothetical protein [Bradyrhizobium lablabi]MBR1125175.1 hypothetical protein [Bradyrhizobium lablabi]
MPNSSPAPILNTSLPPSFRQIRIELARERGHPEGAHNIAYVLVAPLDDDGHIDPETWRQHREACRVARLRPNEGTVHGHLVHRRGGSWAFQYDANIPDEPGYHFNEERFVPGEYVSVNEEGRTHPFRVVAVARL